MPAASRRLWIVAALLMAAWIAALAVLAAATANPVTLNRDQVLHAQFVVTARVVNRAEGLVAVSREWKHGAGIPSDTVRLDNLEQTDARNGREYLIPVTRRPDNRLHVTETRLPNGRPLIYPVTPEATTRLEGLLAEGRKSP